MMRRALLVVAASVFVAAPMAPVRAATPAPIVLIFMENQPYATMHGNAHAPYINKMMAGGMSAANMYAIEPGSKTDYLAATSGRNFKGVTGPIGANNLFYQLWRAGISQRSYEEAMPSPCFPKDTAGKAPAGYVKRHDPEILYTDIRTDWQLCAASVVPAGSGPQTPPGAGSSKLLADARSGRLPAFTFLTPNDCDDMHSCPIASGDAYLAAVVPALVSAGAHVILTWDESGVSQDEHIVLVEYGVGVKAGTFTPVINDYGLLAGLEDHFGLPRLAGAQAATAFPVT